MIIRWLQSMKWFFIAALIIFLMMFGFSFFHVGAWHVEKMHVFVISHRYFWIGVNGFIILGFVLIWPYFMNRLAQKYHWDDADKKDMIHRRWRFTIWLIVIGLIFHLL